MNGSIFVTMIGFFLLVTGPVMLGVALLNHRAGQRSLQWLHTDGKLIEASVGVSRGRNQGTTYYPIVRYRYEAGGSTWEGTRVTTDLSARKGTLEEVRQKLAAWQNQPSLTVYYDPSAPQWSALEVGSDSGSVRFMGAFGGLITLGGVGLLIAAFLGLFGGS